MFDIGWTELLLIAAVTILVVGPKELPGLLRTMGQMVRKVRQVSSDFKNQLDEALQADEIKKLQKDMDDIKIDNPMTDLKDSIENQFDNKDLETYLNEKPDETNGHVESTTNEESVVTQADFTKDQEQAEIEPANISEKTITEKEKVREA